MNNAYAASKLAAHPDTLKDLREGGDGRLTLVHLMPQNLCNQRCAFCSYRMPENKNSLEFNESKALPVADTLLLLADLAAMGVKAIEVTGGGEPLAYPHGDLLWAALRHYGFDTGIVTNGTLLRMPLAEAICASRLKWARVSIDSARQSTYALMRKAPAHHFVRAWNAVSLFRECAPNDPDFRLGVGFVLSNENWKEVYDFVAMAKDHGADNVRLSATFSDQHLSYFQDGVDLKAASDASEQAVADFQDENFKVYNQIPRRLWETEHPVQDYPRCVAKDLMCVVEGEGRVYTCCTFTGSKKGLMGNFLEHPRGFRGVWEDALEFRRTMDPRKYCTVPCLYRERNLASIELIESPTMPPAQEHLHKNFV